MEGYHIEYRFIRIGRWEVDCIFSVDEYDIDWILSFLEDFGVPDDILEQAEDIMSSGKLDTGFTIPDYGGRRAVVVVGPVSSREEFINTLVHEIHHLSVAIARSLGIPLDKEKPAYLSGELAYELVDLICELGCRCNSERIND